MAAEVLDVTSMIPAKFEPKRKNRFVLMIEGIDAYLVKTAARPTVATEEIEVPFMNSRRYLAGKTSFETMALTLHDPIAPSGAQQVMEWVRTHFEPVSGRSGYADFYKRDIQLKMTDPVGTVVELWDIKGAFLTNVTFGDLSYEDHLLSEITLTIRYDNAVLQYLHIHTTKTREEEGLYGGLLRFPNESFRSHLP
jgi:hypothetical protein